MSGFSKKKLYTSSLKSTCIIKEKSKNKNNTPVIYDIWHMYKNYALSIRGTDGQYVTTMKSIINYINHPDFNIQTPNPWNDYLSNLAPSYSASLLSRSAKYPILWYVYEYVDPFYTNDRNTPTIKNRNQGGFILSNYNFSGASLWDGNSNSNVTGSTTIPFISNIAGNRGTDVNGYSMQLPFVLNNQEDSKECNCSLFSQPVNTSCPHPVGTARYNCPTTNNTNKSYNPTLSASNSGNIVNPSDRNIVMKNMSLIKGALWDKFINTTGNVSEQLIKKTLLSNWGTGFEIEGYVEPVTYNKNGSVWLDDGDADKQLQDARFNVDDMYSINISTDSKTYEDWIGYIGNQTHIVNAYKKIYRDATTGGDNGENAQWVNNMVRDKKVALTLITGVMLPVVELTDISKSKRIK